MDIITDYLGVSRETAGFVPAVLLTDKSESNNAE
jgi:hypothetical protein